MIHIGDVIEVTRTVHGMSDTGDRVSVEKECVEIESIFRNNGQRYVWMRLVDGERVKVPFATLQGAFRAAEYLPQYHETTSEGSRLRPGDWIVFTRSHQGAKKGELAEILSQDVNSTVLRRGTQKMRMARDTTMIRLFRRAGSPSPGDIVRTTEGEGEVLDAGNGRVIVKFTKDPERGYRIKAMDARDVTIRRATAPRRSTKRRGTLREGMMVKVDVKGKYYKRAGMIDKVYRRGGFFEIEFPDNARDRFTYSEIRIMPAAAVYKVGDYVEFLQTHGGGIKGQRGTVDAVGDWGVEVELETGDIVEVKTTEAQQVLQLVNVRSTPPPPEIIRRLREFAFGYYKPATHGKLVQPVRIGSPIAVSSLISVLRTAGFADLADCVNQGHENAKRAVETFAKLIERADAVANSELNAALIGEQYGNRRVKVNGKNGTLKRINDGIARVLIDNEGLIEVPEGELT